MKKQNAAVTRLRGIWMDVADLERSRAFYASLGAEFDDHSPWDGIMSATLGGTRLVFEVGEANPPGTGPFVLFDVADADARYTQLKAGGYNVEAPPVDEPWGRQFNVLDPDGHPLAFIGPKSDQHG